MNTIWQKPNLEILVHGLSDETPYQDQADYLQTLEAFADLTLLAVDYQNFPATPQECWRWNGLAIVSDQAILDAINAKAAQEAGDETSKQSAKADSVIQYLVSHTPAEIAGYVQSNVTDLASAKNVLAKLAVAVSVLARKELR
jgi:hypothetical protein